MPRRFARYVGDGDSQDNDWPLRPLKALFSSPQSAGSSRTGRDVKTIERVAARHAFFDVNRAFIGVNYCTMRFRISDISDGYGCRLSVVPQSGKTPNDYNLPSGQI
jgi:hypothetical protein